MLNSTLNEPSRVGKFREWFASNNGYFHPSVAFIEEPSGMSIRASSEVPADSKVVACPFNLAITPQLCKNAIENLLGDGFRKSNEEMEWSEYQLIASYIVLHWILEEDHSLQSEAGKLFKHLPYIHILPPIDVLRTPRYFTPAEKELIQNTDVGKSAIQRDEQQQELFKLSQEAISRFRPEWKDRFTWDRFSAACTYISSRAFPSTVLSPTPSLRPSPSSYPVLLPGVDSLNHARGHPVTWLVDTLSTTSPSSPQYEISLVLHTPTPAGTELLNNYGPKSNAELLLGYGFTIPNNPEDVVAFQTHDPSTKASQRIEVGRNNRGIEPLWEQMKAFTRVSLGTDEKDEEEIEEWELDIEAARTLLSFLEVSKGRIPSVPHEAGEGVRKDVLEMVRWYIQGINDVTDGMVEYAKRKKQEGLEKATSLGIHYEEESDEE